VGDELTLLRSKARHAPYDDAGILNVEAAELNAIMGHRFANKAVKPDIYGSVSVAGLFGPGLS
jgi:hypothetical protein